MVSRGQGSKELDQALPNVTELSDSVDGLPLIHPAVDRIVPGDDGAGEGFNPGGVVAALSARGEQRFGGRRHWAWSSVMRETDTVLPK